MSCVNINTVSQWYNNNCTNAAQNGSQEFYNSLFHNFYPSNQLWIPGINNPTDDQLSFQYLLRDLCNEPSNGGKCSLPLRQICSQYNREDTENPIIRQMCGCYLPQSEYNANINRPCDTVCSAFDTIKYFENSTDQSPQTCVSDVCVIDNITIEATNSNLGNITFNQICPFCDGTSNCRCVISDINIISNDSRLGQINFQQNCGGSIQCYEQTPNGKSEVNCQSYFDSFGINSLQIQQERSKFFWLIILFSILAFILLIILILAFFVFRKNTPSFSPYTYTSSLNFNNY